MPDSNDIVYTQYGIDVERLFRMLLDLVTGSTVSYDSAYAFILVAWWIFVILAYIASAFLLFGIVYAKFRIHELEHIHEHQIEEEEEQYAHTRSKGSKNKRWQDALVHGESDNPNDWRLAIIEADIMLEEILNSLGYSGLTIGDKLKQASPQFFKSLEDGWKAHKVRNEIAHRGSDFILTKRLAKEPLDQYRRVFEEFKVV